MEAIWDWAQELILGSEQVHGGQILGESQGPGLETSPLGVITRWESRRAPCLEPQISALLHPADAGYPTRGRKGWGVTQGVPF